jgi:hypothetical protein
VAGVVDDLALPAEDALVRPDVQIVPKRLQPDQALLELLEPAQDFVIVPAVFGVIHLAYLLNIDKQLYHNSHIKRKHI